MVSKNNSPVNIRFVAKTSDIRNFSENIRSGNPVEDVLQEVTKVMKSIKSTSGKISIKTTTKSNGEKQAHVQG